MSGEEPGESCAPAEDMDIDGYPLPKTICDEDGEIKFFPPMYCQRYDEVKNVLLDERWRKNINKVVDLGCSEMGFFFRVKRIEGINQVLLVDIDRNVLEQHVSRTTPLNGDYMKPRESPLKVDVLCGSVTQTDGRLLGTDAVVCIELVEHLIEEDVPQLVKTVFSYIEPRIAVFTTPNRDFNVLFKGMGTGFRHWDHKFEWSRLEFQKWIDGIVADYPHYDFEIQGIGKPPASHPGDQEIGDCSQMVIFIRKSDYCPNIEKDITERYSLIRSVEYPVYVERRTQKEIIQDELTYQIHSYSKDFMNEEENASYIPLCVVERAVQLAVKGADLESIRSVAKESFPVMQKDDGLFIKYSNSCPSSECDEFDERSNRELNQEFFENDASDWKKEEEGNWDKEIGEYRKEKNEEENWDTEEEEENWDLENSGVVAPSLLYDEERFRHENYRRCIEENMTNAYVEYEMLSDEQRANRVYTIDDSDASDDLDFFGNEDVDDDFVDDSYVFQAFEEFRENHRTYCDIDDDDDEDHVDDKQNETDGDIFSQSKPESELATSVDDQNASKEIAENVTDSGVDLTPTPGNSNTAGKECKASHKSGLKRPVSSKQFPKSTSVEVLHLDSSAPPKRPAGLECVEFTPCSSVTLCYTGKNYCHNPEFSSSTDLPLEPERKSLDGSLVHDVGDSYSFDNDRAGDSGYPNSSSLHHDMDMDLTPEQVDDIVSENEEKSNPYLSEDEVSDVSEGREAVPRRLLQAHPAIPIVVENVENGDLANNNRDGEGNNAVANPNDEREFVAIVQEGEDMIPLMAVPPPEEVVLPDNANPYPDWLEDLLGLEKQEAVKEYQLSGSSFSEKDDLLPDEGLGGEF